MENEEKQSKLQWFVFVVLIPIIFTLVISIIVLTVAGVDVLKVSKDIGSHVPFLSGMLKDESEPEKTPTSASTNKKLNELESTIETQKTEMEKMESIIDSRDQQIQRNEAEKQQLEKELEDIRTAQTKTETELKAIIQTYETMSPKKSAPILTQLAEDESIKILSNMKADTLASIFEQMAPEDAARLTKRLSDVSETN
ncbi:MotE family protein [Peribacillus sp. SCS-155]|uniref:MotE family protein n=1 Tax=Peribacillus sedimenti TaxID=3115297 RepID=UPI0039066E4D